MAKNRRMSIRTRAGKPSTRWTRNGRSTHVSEDVLRRVMNGNETKADYSKMEKDDRLYRNAERRAEKWQQRLKSGCS